MSRKRNEISVQWLESKDKGRINRVNVKHVQSDLQNSTRGSEIIVKLGQRRYRATIVDFLDWEQPEKRRRRKDENQESKRTSGGKNKKNVKRDANGSVGKRLWLASGIPATSKNDTGEESPRPVLKEMNLSAQILSPESTSI